MNAITLFDEAMKTLEKQGKKEQVQQLKNAVQAFAAGFPSRSQEDQEIIAKAFVIKGLERVSKGKEPSFVPKMHMIDVALRKVMDVPVAPKEKKKPEKINGEEEKKKENGENKRGTGQVAETVEEALPLFEDFMKKQGNIYKTFERGVFCATAVRGEHLVTTVADNLKTALIDLAGKMIRENLT